MKKKLFLDDYRKVEDIYNDSTGFTIVKNYDEFVDYINVNGLPDFISFDHDLADEHYEIGVDNYLSDKPIDYAEYTEKTGVDCAKWLIDYCMDNNLLLPNYKVHSANPAGHANILFLLNNFKNHQEKESKNK